MGGLSTWKRRPQTAGAMLLVKGYVPTVTRCDACGRALEHDGGFIDVRFAGQTACYDCPHCGHASARAFVIPAGDASG